VLLGQVDRQRIGVEGKRAEKREKERKALFTAGEAEEKRREKERSAMVSSS
jgi:hypothetical protein